jgi:hypothetical protein
MNKIMIEVETLNRQGTLSSLKDMHEFRCGKGDATDFLNQNSSVVHR